MNSYVLIMELFQQTMTKNVSFYVEFMLCQAAV